MIKTCAMIALASGVLFATVAFAQLGPDRNPMGLDYGPFHPQVPPQVTTYYPPEPSAVPHRRHVRSRRPAY